MLEDGLNEYVFPLEILLAKGKKVVLATIYLGSLYARLDECIPNMTRSLGCYDYLFVDVSMRELWRSCA